MPRRLPLAALLTAGAGVTHLAAAVPHFAGEPAYGVLFATAGWAQVLLAGLLVTSARGRVVWTAMAAHTAAVIVWAISRSVGLPLTHPEPILLADALTVALEVAAVGLLVARLRGVETGLHEEQASALSLAAVLTVVMGGSTIAIADLALEGHAHGTDADESPVGNGHDEMATEPSSEGHMTSAMDRVHVHPDGTVHVHESGEPHVHSDGTLHVHVAQDTDHSDEGNGQDDGHDHDHEEGAGH